MKITAIIPCVYTHLSKIHRVLDCYVKNTRKPDQVLISLNGCKFINNQYISHLENIYQSKFTEFTIIKNMEILSRGKARNVCIPYIKNEIVCFSDADDEEHTQRFEIIDYFFTHHDIVHLLHSYMLIKCHNNECGNCVLCKKNTYNTKFIQYDDISKINYCNSYVLNELNYPSDTDTDIKPNVKSVIGLNSQNEQIMPVHGLVCIRKSVLDDIKFREDYPRGQDSLFSQEVLYKYKKSILIDAQLHIYDNGWIPNEKEFHKIGDQYINFGSPNPPKPGTPRTQDEINSISKKIQLLIQGQLQPKQCTVKKILFVGFIREAVECIHGDYKYLRDCGNNGFISKYWNKPPGTFVTADMHSGITKLKGSPFEKHRKHFCFEGGPLVGIKALIYNLSLRPDIKIELTNDLSILDGATYDFDFCYVHMINDHIKKYIIRNSSKFNNKLILSLHLDQKDYNDMKCIKHIKWAHNSNHPSNYYIAYPIHRTLYEKYPLKKINASRDKEILLYFKRDSKHRHLKDKMILKKKYIEKYFNENGYKTHIIDYSNVGYRRSELMDIANKCKLCLYLSYYDNGALAINEITMMGCFIVGHQDIINGHSYHSIAKSCILDGITGIYMNEFANIFKPPYDNDIYLKKCCDKVIDFLETREFNHVDIAKRTRDYFTEDRFLETVFKK